MNKDMKKKYIQPTVQVVKIQQSQMLCTSSGNANGVAGNTGSIWDSDGFEDSDDDV